MLSAMGFAQEMARRVTPLYVKAVKAAVQSEKIGWNREVFLHPEGMILLLCLGVFLFP